MKISSLPSKYFVATSQYVGPTLVLLLCLLTLYLLFFSPLFRISQVECYQDFEEPCRNDFILTHLTLFRGVNLFRFDAHAESIRLKRADPTIRTLTIQKLLPGKLVFQIQTVYPSFALGTIGSDEVLVFDADLRLIKATKQDPHVPLVRTSSTLSFRVGERVSDPALQKLLTACLQIARTVPGATEFLLKDSVITTKLDSGRIQAVFTAERNLDDQLSALHTIRTGATISDRGVVIDVRYLQPIIKEL